VKNTTIMARARRGIVPSLLRRVAREEDIRPDDLCEDLISGRTVVARPGGKKGGAPSGIGRGLRVKVNANLGTSQARSSLRDELKKLKTAVEAGADAVMDLSTAGSLDAVRRKIIAASTVPVGTVPIYQAAVRTLEESPGRIDRMTPDNIFDAIEKHGADGVAFVTVHCGLTLESLARVRDQGRALGVVSRGGAFLAEWMVRRGEENPLYSRFDRLLEIAARHDLILSLGDALRPGSLQDATDRGQIQELIILGELTARAWDAGVQVMIEGPGHMPLDQIQANVFLEKKLCHGAPFYVLGPLVTDIAPGYDHITSAIGGALAAWFGADFLCYVTPAEHLGLPSEKDVRLGVISSRIAAHAADLARGRKSAWDRDRRMTACRQSLDWKGQAASAIDPLTVEAFRRRGDLPEGEVCTMCGDYCSIKGMQDVLSCLPATTPAHPGKGRRKSPSRGNQGEGSRGSTRKS
jgi:phosphomethylpyrimidine synthase